MTISLITGETLDAIASNSLAQDGIYSQSRVLGK